MELRPVPRHRPMAGTLWAAVACAILAPLVLLVVVPAVLGLHRYVVSSHAMDGSISRGSLILAEQVPVASLRPGDVISFVPPEPWAGDGMTTRRVATVGSDGITTAADSSGLGDPWILPASTPSVSRMVVHVPWIGYPFLGAVDRTMWLMLASVPLAAIALALAGDVERSRRSRRAVVVIAASPPGDTESTPQPASVPR